MSDEQKQIDHLQTELGEIAEELWALRQRALRALGAREIFNNEAAEQDNRE